jgi:glycosyltransferase involved in cell wall biosynthesis
VILINGRAAARPEVSGVERWAREMAERLPRLRADGYRVAWPPAGMAHRAGHLWEQVALPARARRERAALVFSPANLAPVAWPRNVVVIHDAVALRHPELFSRAYVVSQRALLPRVARRARRVITVSDFSRREIAELLRVPPERISVVPGGVDERFSAQADPEPARRALGLDRPYVLTVGAAGARKNLGALAEAARRLEAGGVELVAAGGGRAHLMPGQASGVRRLGWVPDDHLPGLYAGAAAFVLPSLHEGFGLTAIEAMACGTPVVAAARGALPETVGDAGVLVDPGDQGAVAQAVMSVVGDRALAGRLRAAGLERAARFSWERTAREVDALLAAETAG